MAVSLDGKIATKARGPMKLGTRHDSRRMDELRAANDAVINGAGTFRAYPFPLIVKSPALIARRKGRQPISAIVSSRLAIVRGTPWEKAVHLERWVFCGAKAPAATARSLEAMGIRVVRCRGARPEPREIAAALQAGGVKRLLLEGGGELNAAFLEAGLVQRIHLTLTPLLIGGADSPSWCEGQGFERGKFPRFRLSECRRRGAELFLTYERPKSRGK